MPEEFANHFEVPNPHYSASDFRGEYRTGTVSADQGIKARYSPLVDGGKWKIRTLLFDKDHWNSLAECQAWVSAHKEGLKSTQEGDCKMSEVKFKQYACESTKVTDFSFEAMITTEDVDRVGEVVKAAGVDFEGYLKNNPTVLFCHAYQSPPIAKTTNMRIVPGRGVAAQFSFPPVGIYPFADQIRGLWEFGALSSVSIGYQEKRVTEPKTKDDPRIIEECTLLEYSIVPVPANESATAIRTGFKAVEYEAWEKGVNPTEAKGATPFGDLPTAPEETAWSFSAEDGNAILGENEDWARYKKAHFWFDPEKADTRAGYKLPFAKIVGDTLTAVWRGVVAAMAAMGGGRGGVDIPKADVAGVMSHIERYYAKFDKPLPGEKGEDDFIHCGSVADAVVKIGQAISGKRREVLTAMAGDLRGHADKLQAMLDETAPAEPEKTEANIETKEIATGEGAEVESPKPEVIDEPTPSGDSADSEQAPEPGTGLEPSSVEKAMQTRLLERVLPKVK